MGGFRAVWMSLCLIMAWLLLPGCNAALVLADDDDVAPSPGA